MEAQEVFDITLNHFRKQGKPSFVMKESQSYDEYKNYNYESCMYRDGNGNMCAVGVHIPDEIYSEEMEQKDIYNLLDDYSKALPSWFDIHQYLLYSLQTIHDDIYSSWDTSGFSSLGEERMQKLAEDIGVEYKNG